MAETIFTSEQVEKLTREQGSAVRTAFYTIIPWLAKYFFMGNRPCYACNWKRKQQEPNNLVSKCHVPYLGPEIYKVQRCLHPTPFYEIV